MAYRSSQVLIQSKPKLLFLDISIARNRAAKFVTIRNNLSNIKLNWRLKKSLIQEGFQPADLKSVIRVNIEYFYDIKHLVISVNDDTMKI